MCEVKEIQIRTWGWLGTWPEGCYGHPMSQRWVSPHLLRPREHSALHRLPPPPQHLDLGLSLLSADTTVSECAVCRLPELCAIWVVVTANSCRKLSPGTPPASHLVSPPFPPRTSSSLGWVARGKSCPSVLWDTASGVTLAPIFLLCPQWSNSRRNWGPLGQDDEDRTGTDYPTRSSNADAVSVWQMACLVSLLNGAKESVQCGVG